MMEIDSLEIAAAWFPTGVPNIENFKKCPKVPELPNFTI